MESPFDEIQAAERRILDAETARIRAEHGSLTLDAVLEYGRPSVILARHSDGARLAVLGTHRRGALTGLLLGSVGHDLLMNMLSPIVIVPDLVPRDHDDSLEPSGAEEVRA